MKPIPPFAHGVLDYVTGFGLLAAPAIFDLDLETASGRVPVILGVATLVYSLLTRYPLGLLKVLSLKTHFRLDYVNGVFLALSPWMFDFAENGWVPHVAVGAFEIVAVSLSRSETAAVAPSNSLRQGQALH